MSSEFAGLQDGWHGSSSFLLRYNALTSSCCPAIATVKDSVEGNGLKI